MTVASLNTGIAAVLNEEVSGIYPSLSLSPFLPLLLCICMYKGNGKVVTMAKSKTKGSPFQKFLLK